MQSQRESDNGGIRITKGMAITGVRAGGCLGRSESKTLKGDSGALPGVETALSLYFLKSPLFQILIITIPFIIGIVYQQGTVYENAKCASLGVFLSLDGVTCFHKGSPKGGSLLWI